MRKVLVWVSFLQPQTKTIKTKDMKMINNERIREEIIYFIGFLTDQHIDGPVLQVHQIVFGQVISHQVEGVSVTFQEFGEAPGL